MAHPAASNDGRIDSVVAEEKLGAILAAWQDAHNTTLDPRLLRELAGEFVHAAGIFTYGHEPGSQRHQRFNDESWVRPIVIAHLKDLAQSPRMVKTLFARLGEGVGIDPERSGWPSTKVNSYILKDFTSLLADEPYLLVSDDFPSSLGLLSHRRFVVGPGDHEIYSGDGQQLAFSIDASAPERSVEPNKSPLPARGLRPR